MPLDPKKFEEQFYPEVFDHKFNAKDIRPFVQLAIEQTKAREHNLSVTFNKDYTKDSARLALSLKYGPERVDVVDLNIVGTAQSWQSILDKLRRHNITLHFDNQELRNFDIKVYDKKELEQGYITRGPLKLDIFGIEDCIRIAKGQLSAPSSISDLLETKDERIRKILDGATHLVLEYRRGIVDEYSEVMISTCNIRKNPNKTYDWLYNIHTIHKDPLPEPCFEELNSLFKLIVKRFTGNPSQYMTVNED